MDPRADRSVWREYAKAALDKLRELNADSPGAGGRG